MELHSALADFVSLQAVSEQLAWDDIADDLDSRVCVDVRANRTCTKHLEMIAPCRWQAVLRNVD